MKNIALIFAGGSGSRMNSVAKPKQFLAMYGKEIIIHTIEKFERHAEIDQIVVVCIAEWMEYLEKLLITYQIKKVIAIVPGGTTGQKSIYNGLKAIHDLGENDSIVLVHDGVRPLITEELISQNIKMASKHGAAITVSPAIETIVNLKDSTTVRNIIDRSVSFNAKAPQTFLFNNLWKAHNKAMEEGVEDMIDSASLMMHHGYELHIVRGGTENIKITTPSDFYMFRALYEAKENSQIFGI